MPLIGGKTRQEITGQIREAAGRIGTGLLAAVAVAVTALLVAVAALVIAVKGRRLAHGG